MDTKSNWRSFGGLSSTGQRKGYNVWILLSGTCVSDKEHLGSQKKRFWKLKTLCFTEPYVKTVNKK